MVLASSVPKNAKKVTLYPYVNISPEKHQNLPNINFS